ncbi:hypothetical protein [Roseisolibacter sp. H3M3-2]|uniref:hypothetical protein n=1 Tax=Roseisolibacter sp. H3M3-2 TaxID=3031323 RepID=UPI0023DC99FA|nr:hypothetical protein [Roseisolibacter sp. H3M3-2]MDF1503435.1 hypothetical protein [Roseisolibacter sp. H3M3-2]
MTSPFPESGHPARRTLRRDQPGREGLEAELVARLTRDVAPEAARRALLRCLDGDLSPRATLAMLVLAQGSVTTVRELVDEITARTDEDSRAGDSLVRDRADELTRLFVEHEAALGRAVARWRADPGWLEADGAAADEASYFERTFDRMLAAGS